jgi:hypothetical protein
MGNALYNIFMQRIRKRLYNDEFWHSPILQEEIRVWNLASHIEDRTKIEGVWEQSAGENI